MITTDNITDGGLLTATGSDALRGHSMNSSTVTTLYVRVVKTTSQPKTVKMMTVFVVTANYTISEKMPNILSNC